VVATNLVSLAMQFLTPDVTDTGLPDSPGVVGVSKPTIDTPKAKLAV
jgi:hypothetical protein